ncbi:hypothetical protein BHYA_0079g00040 [Botrytis hyacinthi]|uniref:GST N-terminal domain-containing protein n=1 Tax=Botrytis hyacinthi TaxID=278943 RepID=A0A4Z1GNE4_9HELO|nr:hypothetical protein BHYA_0079g00040 [Botrytis hyacinthi]
MTQPITLYNAKTKKIADNKIITGPNAWKVAIILEELKIPYTIEYLEITDLKKPPFESLDPNSRVPAITDPNTSLTLWESGAIMEYLIDTYDRFALLSYTSFPERYHVKQWLHFQMSGQGPCYGQAVWFAKYHSEKLDSATERYFDQIKRLLYALDKHLNGKEWLVGDKCTYADLAFIPWDKGIPRISGDRAGELEMEKDFPHFWKWHAKMMERPSVKKIIKDKEDALRKKEAAASA